MQNPNVQTRENGNPKGPDVDPTNSVVHDKSACATTASDNKETSKDVNQMCTGGAEKVEQQCLKWTKKGKYYSEVWMCGTSTAISYLFGAHCISGSVTITTESSTNTCA